MPEQNTAVSGVQDTTESQVEQTAVNTSGDEQTTQQNTAEESTSYFDSEESLKKKIFELQTISRIGNSEEVAEAAKELDKIENYLLDVKNNPTEPTVERKEPVVDEKSTDQKSGDNSEQTEPKKFFVHWQGQRIEREDGNSLLGYNSTGDLKAAHIKMSLENKAIVDDLIRRLRETEEKLKENQTPQQQAPVMLKPPPQTPVEKTTVVQRPVPPDLPQLSTNDPSLYTEDDIKSLDGYQKATNDFNRKMIDYVASLENRPGQNDESLRQEIEEIKKWRQDNANLFDEIKIKEQKLAEEQADFNHWKKFSDFIDKHKSFETPLPPKQMRDKMNDWMDTIALANGIQKPVTGADDNYMIQRAGVVNKYLNGDQVVLQNAAGYKPPDGHEQYFRLCELNSALKTYVDNGVFGKNATLEDAYLRMKADSGEIETDIETMRANERAKAAEQFASGVDELQQTAVNVDPSTSSGGPDLNELGIQSSDLRWFASIGEEKLQELQSKNPDDFKKWHVIANKIQSKYG